MNVAPGSTASGSSASTFCSTAFPNTGLLVFVAVTATSNPGASSASVNSTGAVSNS